MKTEMVQKKRYLNSPGETYLWEVIQTENMAQPQKDLKSGGLQCVFKESKGIRHPSHSLKDCKSHTPSPRNCESEWQSAIWAGRCVWNCKSKTRKILVIFKLDVEFSVPFPFHVSRIQLETIQCSSRGSKQSKKYGEWNGRASKLHLETSSSSRLSAV